MLISVRVRALRPDTQHGGWLPSWIWQTWLLTKLYRYTIQPRMTRDRKRSSPPRCKCDSYDDGKSQVSALVYTIFLSAPEALVFLERPCSLWTFPLQTVKLDGSVVVLNKAVLLVTVERDVKGKWRKACPDNVLYCLNTGENYNR